MSDLLSSLYIQMVNGINSAQSVSSEPSVKETEDAGQSTVSFQEILAEQVEELQELLQSDETSAMSGLEDVLDQSILGNDALDLNSLSEEMLYSSGGSSVIAQLMDGHFSSMVMATSETAEDESHLAQMWDNKEENQAEQIEKLLTNIQNTIGSLTEE